MSLLAFALGTLTHAQALALAGAAIVLNWLVLPRLSADMRRPGGPFLDGVKTYPLAVFALIAALPPSLAAGAWLVLGFGDSASNVVGRRLRPGTPLGARLLGRDDRSLGGTAAFVLFGGPAAAAGLAVVGEVPFDTRVLSAGFGAAAAGALAELAWRARTLDDNLPIAAAAGVTLWLLA